MLAVRFSSFAPTCALSDALSGCSELEYKHPLVKFGDRPEHLAYQPAGRIVVAAGQVHAVCGEEATPIFVNCPRITLHARPLDQLTSRILVAEGELAFPFFSPDNEAVGLYDRSSAPMVLKQVPLQGGPVMPSRSHPPSW